MAKTFEEKTFTRFPNILLEILPLAHLTLSQIRVLLVIIRYTFGYHKKHHEFSLEFLAANTGIDESNISKVLNQLLERKIILEIRKRKRQDGRYFELNLDYDNFFNKK